jgi:uncharacterized protein YqjF (DUF2071 family)
MMSTATAVRVKPGVFLTAGWRHLVMLNFTIDPAVLEPLVPRGTELDFWNGQAYVSVVGFQFVNARILGIPAPFHGSFEEVNLRFYVVRHVDGEMRRGIVFIREIAPKWLVTLIARWFYNENYVTMTMRQRIELPRRNEAGLVQYEWFHAGRWQHVSAHLHGDAHPLASGSEEEFIAEHYFGYTRQPDGSTMEYEVEHPPWRIWQASSPNYDCDVASIYGVEFVPWLRRPSSVFVADGSAITVRRGQRIA